jgi:ABC-2 type transport system ATP-binding protein
VTPLLRLAGVRKRYGGGPLVLDDVDLDVTEGHVIGILGANGSGKSTLLRILAGVSRPTSGTLTGDPVLGYLPDRFPAAQRMGARSYLRHMARIRGLRDLSVVDDLLAELPPAGGVRVPMRQLSKGNAQKVGLAQALLGRPDLLVLDEPWSGLDTDTHAALDDVVAKAKARGAAVVFTDHRPDVVHARADHAYRMLHGRLVAQHGPAGEPSTRIVLQGPASGDWRTEPGIVVSRVDGGRVELRVAAGRSDAVLLLALRRGWSVLEVGPC